MNDERGSWYLLTGILLGIALGLFFAWVIAPVEYIDTPPMSLQEIYKEQYRASIAAAYQATGNLDRARARLSLLEDKDSALVLVAQAQRYLAAGDAVQDAQALANLAAALGQVPTPLPTQPEATATLQPSETHTRTASPMPTASLTAILSPTDVITSTASTTQDGTPKPTQSPTLTRKPSSTPTQIQTHTPTATLAPPFVLNNRVEVCNPALTVPQLQIFVSNAAGIGIPGVEVIVTWDAGEDHFFTGLKPDIDTGYADFVMTPEIMYTLQVADGGQLIPGLTAPLCTGGAGNTYWGSLRLVFSHP